MFLSLFLRYIFFTFMGFKYYVLYCSLKPILYTLSICISCFFITFYTISSNPFFLSSSILYFRITFFSSFKPIFFVYMFLLFSYFRR